MNKQATDRNFKPTERANVATDRNIEVTERAIETTDGKTSDGKTCQNDGKSY